MGKVEEKIKLFEENEELKERLIGQVNLKEEVKKINYSEIRELHRQHLEILLHEILLNTLHHQIFNQMNIKAVPEYFYTSYGSLKHQ